MSYHQYSIACVSCGSLTSKSYARSHEGKCKACSTGQERIEHLLVCPDCGAANSGNLTCRTCRQANREAGRRHGWNIDYLDKLDEINPVTIAPVGVEEARRFMERLGAEV